MAEYVEYSKNFENFEDGVEDIVKYVPSLNSFFDSARSEEEALINLTKAFLSNAPISDNPNFPYTYTFSADAHGVHFNTDRRMSFGWKVNIIEGAISYTFRVSFPNAFKKSIAEINLKSNDWKIREYHTKRRFVRNKTNTTNNEDK